MKTQRRQELKANDLSVYLQQVSEYFNKHAGMITIVSIGVIAVVAAAVFANRTAVQHREYAWEALNSADVASRTPGPERATWQKEMIASWEDIVDNYGDTDVAPLARYQIIQFCLRQFLESETGDMRGQLLDTAEKHCNSTLNSAGSNTTLKATALNALSAIEQNRYVLDGDLAHKETAKSYLERIRNGPEFVGTAFQDDVLTRLNEFDSLWHPLVLLDPPVVLPVGPLVGPPAEPEPVAEPAEPEDAATPPADPPVDAGPPSNEGDPEEVPGEAGAAPKADPPQEPSDAEDASDAGEAGPTRSAGGGDAEPKEAPPNPSEQP
ncbi:MAG: hypothetical protein IH895_01700 [Planctomycetes bacterium]|nr:hypothetical protein [Planctomycetota bacterium]